MVHNTTTANYLVSVFSLPLFASQLHFPNDQVLSIWCGFFFVPVSPFCFALFASFICNCNSLLMDHLKPFLFIITIPNAFFCSLKTLKGKSFSLILNLNSLFRKRSSHLPFSLVITLSLWHPFTALQVSFLYVLFILHRTLTLNWIHTPLS